MISDKYTTADKKDLPESKDKKVLSDDTYVLAEAIENLATEIRRSRK